jgi:dihydroxyacetone kinase-like predicted kinase
VLDTLDAAAVRRWCGGGLEALRAHQHEIDELNVYPVPDGDTGTNLVLTLTSAQEALDLGSEDGAGSTPLGRAMRRMARGALLGARGNSGVIVSQILRGMADSFAGSLVVRGGELARAFRTATEAAYAAVAKPVEGTVLSVVAAAAEGAGRIKSDDLLAVARAAAHSASEALARTPQQLPVLARAGVVDAGGRGLCLLLDALVDALGGRDDESGAEVVAGPSRVGEDHASGTLADNDAGTSPAAVRGPDRGRPPAPPGGVPAPPGGVSAPPDRDPAPPGRVPAPPDGDPAPPGRVPAPPDGDPAAPGGSVPAAPGVENDLGYEVQYLLDAESAAVDGLRRVLDSLGDSLVVVGTGDGAPPTWNVHVHVGAGEIGPAVEAGVAAGRPHRITVTPLEDRRHGHDHEQRDSDDRHRAARHADELPGAQRHGAERHHAARHGDELPGAQRHGAERQHADGPDERWPGRRAGDERRREQRWGERPGAGGSAAGSADADRDDADRDDARGAVVVAAGDGLTALFEDEGATVVARNPSTREILAAIAATGAGRVVLLPNDANTHAVARSAAREAEATGVRVSVVPTRSPVQALAALAVRDPGRPFADDVIAMAEAAGACRYGEVCTAQRQALTVAGPCRAGDLLGLVDGEVHVIGADLEDVSRRLLDRMLGGGGELATLVLGADAPPELERTLHAHVTRTWPFVEWQCYAGGQPRYHLLVGVE